MLSAIFSLVCLTINIAVLYSINGKPYSTFHMKSIDITPNTFISIVSIFQKSAFLLPVCESISQLKWIYFQQRAHKLSDLQIFDAGSRGPLGALRLLCKLRSRAILASCGSFLIILSIAAEPFTQQILSYPIRATPAHNITASIGAAKAYGGVDLQYYGLEKHFPSERAAMSSAIFGSPVQASYQCSSGTCNWPTFRSLALCNQCEDISTETLVHCNKEQAFCTYSLRNHGIMVWSIWVPQTNTKYISTSKLNVTVRYGAFPLGGTQQEIVTLFSVRFNNSYESEPKDVVPLVQHCKMSWCINTYTTTRVEDGVLRDKPTHQNPLWIDPKSCFRKPHAYNSGV